MKKQISIALLTLFATVSLNAQEVRKLGENDVFSASGYAGYSKGEVVLKQDERLLKLIEKHIDYNKAMKGFPGWRVQIYLGADRQKAESIFQDFKAKFSDSGVYIDYKQPFFTVRVGDFRTKLEALKLKNELPFEFNNSWPVEDIVEFIDLKGEKDVPDE